MILRRFMKHVTDQNWFAVGLDVIVVIVGIYLGLQVQQWSEDRADRIDEQKYLNRLHLEVTQALITANVLLQLRTDRHEELGQVIEMLKTDDENGVISPRQCYAIIASSIYLSSAGNLPTIEELMSTGKVSIITSDEVRNAMSQYAVRLAFWEGMSSSIQTGLEPLFRDYGSFFEVDLSMDTIPITNEEINNYSHACKLDMMRDSIEFKNALGMRYATLGSYIELFHVQHVEQLNSIRHALDIALSINYDEENL